MRIVKPVWDIKTQGAVINRDGKRRLSEEQKLDNYYHALAALDRDHTISKVNAVRNGLRRIISDSSNTYLCTFFSKRIKSEGVDVEQSMAFLPFQKKSVISEFLANEDIVATQSANTHFHAAMIYRYFGLTEKNAEYTKKSIELFSRAKSKFITKGEIYSTQYFLSCVLPLIIEEKIEEARKICEEFSEMGYAIASQTFLNLLELEDIRSGVAIDIVRKLSEFGVMVEDQDGTIVSALDLVSMVEDDTQKQFEVYKKIGENGNIRARAFACRLAVSILGKEEGEEYITQSLKIFNDAKLDSLFDRVFKNSVELLGVSFIKKVVDVIDSKNSLFLFFKAMVMINSGKKNDAITLLKIEFKGKSNKDKMVLIDQLDVNSAVDVKIALLQEWFESGIVDVKSSDEDVALLISTVWCTGNPKLMKMLLRLMDENGVIFSRRDHVVRAINEIEKLINLEN